MSFSSVSYGPWFNLILEMEKAMDSGEYNIHLMFYEDLKKVFLNVYNTYTKKYHCISRAYSFQKSIHQCLVHTSIF